MSNLSDKLTPSGKRERFEWTAETVARELYFYEKGVLSEEKARIVNMASEYLKKQGYVLRGTPADGNCYFHAFLRSARKHPKIQLSIPPKDQVQFLRNLAAKQYLSQRSSSPKRAGEIRTMRKWVHSDEGYPLAKALGVPIRLITVIEGQVEFSSACDTVYFPKAELETSEWAALSKDQRPKNYIVIVDIGGHFVWAEPHK